MGEFGIREMSVLRKVGSYAQKGTSQHQFRPTLIRREAAEGFCKYRMRAVAAQCYVIDRGAQFEEFRTLSACEISGGSDIGGSGGVIGVGAGTQPEAVRRRRSASRCRLRIAGRGRCRRGLGWSGRLRSATDPSRCRRR